MRLVHDMTFGAGTEFAGNQSFTAGTQTFGGAATFANGTAFYAGQDFSSYTHTFTDHQTFGAGTGFNADQSFAGDVEFSGLFDYSDMVGKSLVFEGICRFLHAATC